MDDQRFDRIAVQFGLVMNRRHVGGLLAALGLGAGLGPAREAEAKRKRKRKKKPPACTPLCVGQACGDPDGCGGTCKDGSCPGTRICVDGACKDDCPGPQKLCSTGCVALDTNSDCGDCGIACADHASCTDGQCVCNDGFTRCGDECIATNDCCTDEAPGCPDNRTCCVEGGQGVCRNTSTDENNCGGCGPVFACDNEEQCIGGDCQPICAPECAGKDCGSDGCAGTCGDCPTDRVCNDQGQCVCPFATCNGDCCGQGQACQGGVCTCMPDCAGKECGSDGCGGSCGNCGEDQACQSGVCTARPCDVCATGCAFASVQTAINAASPGATIIVCPGDYREALSIRADLRLIGAGDGNSTGDTILRGTGTAPVVEIAKDATVTLKKLRLTGGRDQVGEGGGINNRGTTTVVGCTVVGNTSANSGGGVSNYQGTLTLTGCTVTGNTAENWGGGIDNREGALILSDSIVTGNTASGTTSRPGGGGLHTYGGTMELTGCTVSENRALIVGGGIYNELGKVTLTDCTVSANTVTYVGFGLSTGNRGGGITSDGGTLTLTRCTVSDNIAHEGGGIMLEASAVPAALKLIDSEISGNKAARLSGGGIRSAAGTVDLVNSVIRGNSACCENPQAGGGGISVLFGGVKFDEDSRVMENAAAGTGGGIYNGASAVTLFAPDNVIANAPNNCAGDPVAQCEN